MADDYLERSMVVEQAAAYEAKCVKRSLSRESPSGACQTTDGLRKPVDAIVCSPRYANSLGNIGNRLDSIPNQRKNANVQAASVHLGDPCASDLFQPALKFRTAWSTIAREVLFQGNLTQRGPRIRVHSLQRSRVR